MPALSTDDLPGGPALDQLVAAARHSVTDVPNLHNFAVGHERQGDVPGPVIASEAGKLRLRFSAGSTKVAKFDGEASQALADAFTAYADLAEQLERAAQGPKPLPATFADALAGTDATWRAAVQAIGEAADTDLLATLPPLLLPDGPADTTVPPPPR